MITLHQFPPPQGLPVSASPYCSRLEVYLRLTGREFETVEAPDPRKSPSKTVPWVTWSDGGTMADSSEIIAHLEARGPSLDEELAEADRVRGEALFDKVDGPIYFSSLFARFTADDGWVHQKAYISGGLPWVLTLFVPAIVRRSQIKRCAAHGFARASDYSKAVTAIGDVAEALGDKPFVLGDAPTVVDCGIWAQLVCCMHTTQSTPPRDTARGDRRLVAYVERIAERIGVKIPSFGA